jgi:nicotinate-nucleotide pyrophosphorylase (carboxylating)
VTGEGVLRPQLRTTLAAAGLDPAEVVRVVRRALEEDLALGPDVTTNSTVPAGASAVGDVVPRIALLNRGGPRSRCTVPPGHCSPPSAPH